MTNFWLQNKRKNHGGELNLRPFSNPIRNFVSAFR
jgi:hypothetical protein